MATVSRSGERQAVDGVLASAEHAPSALVICGEPGIGKTTLWLAGVERARELGFRVLSTRADEAESVLSYAAVADLLEDVPPEAVAGLPGLQRVAVDRVLLRMGSDGPPTDHRVTGSALASLVSALATDRPVLLAIDDAQWLDVSSQAVLAFAATRLSGRVGLLLTARSRAADPDPLPWLRLGAPDAVGRVHVGPLSLGALHSLILDRFGKAFPRPTMVRIAEVSGGNPFYALEMARGVDRQSTVEDSTLPSTLTEIVRMRTAHFDGTVGDLLLAACSVTDATIDLVAEAVGVSVARAVELLEEPQREGVVRIDGNRVRFVHPLLSRGIYTHAGPARRRRMHRALAAVESQPELKARHMALGAVTADPQTLHALDEAAAAAIGRGAAAAAADLYELAINLGGDVPSRRLSAAEQHLRAGATRRARGMLEPALDGFEAGGPHAAALILLGAARMSEHEYTGALPLFGAAVDDARGDLGLQLRARLWLARAQSLVGNHDAARREAQRAAEDAERCADPKLISQAIALRVMLDCAHGLARDEAALARALDLEVLDPDVSAPFRASVVDAVTKAWTGRLEEALAGLIAARRRCVEMGSDADMVYVAGYLSMVYVWLGRYSVAVDVAQDALRRGQDVGGYPAVIGRTQRALASAYLGRERTARDDARAAIAGALECGAPHLAGWPTMALGFLELSLGDYEKALETLQPMIDRTVTGQSRGVLQASFIPDAVEALVALGRVDDARPLAETLERHAAQLDWPWLWAVGARCRSLVQAAAGDLADAEASLRLAMVWHARLPMPFEQARTQLFLGQVLRRQRRKNLAAAALREALATFEELAMPLWANRARNELKRTDAPRANDSELTPSESRVARLAASGMSNKDIAAALFISPKTVEHNLSSVYRKLKVRTRAGLAGHAAALGTD